MRLVISCGSSPRASLPWANERLALNTTLVSNRARMRPRPSLVLSRSQEEIVYLFSGQTHRNQRFCMQQRGDRALPRPAGLANLNAYSGVSTSRRSRHPPSGLGLCPRPQRTSGQNSSRRNDLSSQLHFELSAPVAYLRKTQVRSLDGPSTHRASRAERRQPPEGPTTCLSTPSKDT